jgi:hypothetical protein
MIPALPILLALCLPGQTWTAEVTEAVRMVESGGVDHKTGDHGLARGPLQAHRAAWDEACRWAGVRWPYDRLAWSREHSRRVFLWYGEMHGARTPEQFARCWNSGPAWRVKYRQTNGYWAKVLKYGRRR